MHKTFGDLFGILRGLIYCSKFNQIIFERSVICLFWEKPSH